MAQFIQDNEALMGWDTEEEFKHEQMGANMKDIEDKIKQMEKED